MKSEGTEKEQIISYLQRNKKLLRITEIQRLSGVPNLNNIINENKDAKGYTFTLPDKHVPKLAEIISKLSKII